MFHCVWIESLLFYLCCSFQVCVTKAMSIYKNAVSSWIVELTSKSCELCIIVVLADVSEWVRIYSSESYNKTGDFILDLYWSGCNNDWLTFNTWLTRIWLVQLIEPWPRILYWMCVLLPSGETQNHMNIQKERSRLWDRSSLPYPLKAV